MPLLNPKPLSPMAFKCREDETSNANPSRLHKGPSKDERSLPIYLTNYEDSTLTLNGFPTARTSKLPKAAPRGEGWTSAAGDIADAEGAHCIAVDRVKHTRPVKLLRSSRLGYSQ